jgi:hypothetical protein
MLESYLATCFFFFLPFQQSTITNENVVVWTYRNGTTTTTTKEKTKSAVVTGEDIK